MLFNSYIIPTELILRILHDIKTDIVMDKKEIFFLKQLEHWKKTRRSSTTDRGKDII
jgi:hypothetical protein